MSGSARPIGYHAVARMWERAVGLLFSRGWGVELAKNERGR
jgi:hypothetical protein